MEEFVIGLHGEESGVVDIYQQLYTLDDVAEHSDRDDCYYSMYGKIYDMTEYADEHPGGTTRILRECGTEATEGKMYSR